MYSVDYAEISRAIKDAKRVLIQLPDGLKPQVLEIQRQFPGVEIIFWSGSNYGACDLPVGLEKVGIDVLIHLGHSEWVY